MERRKVTKRKQSKLKYFKGGQLTKGQKKHLKEFGELHPVDLDDSIEDDDQFGQKTRLKKKKKIERIIDDSLRIPKMVKKVENNLPHHSQGNSETRESDVEDDLEETSAYDRLVSSFRNGRQSTIKKLKRKVNKQSKKVDDIVSEEEEESDAEIPEEEIKLDGTKGNAILQDEHDSFDDLEDGSDSDDEMTSSNGIPSDPFSLHFESDIEESVVHRLEESNKSTVKPVKSLLTVGTVLHYPPVCEVNNGGIPSMDSQVTPEKLWVRARLCKTWNEINQTTGLQGSFTSLQQELFPILNSYQDLLYSSRDFDNAEEIREMYCLHVLNHILKELRDHGLTRPKVLIMVPFRDAVLRIVNIFIELLTQSGEGQVMNKKRFLEEYSENDSGSGAQNKPDDFKKLFAGNTDDFFRVGVIIMRKGMKLFTEFYSSDIIIASPVGLRSIIGAEGEKNRDYDFLSSIEVIIMDQVDVFLMQNWEHVQHVFEHLHLQPKDSHDVDFSRVRMWNLNGWSKFYRQTVLFCGCVSPEINFIFNKHCCNYSGKSKILPAANPGTVCQVVVQIPQVFHRVFTSNHKEIAEKRFDFFVNKIFPELKGASGLITHTAIFIPSYFDFVRLRNYLKKEEIDFLQLSEYTSRANISRSRNSFLRGTKPLLLFTERFYFYYRYRIRGIKNIIFYELPHYAHFYSEIINFMDTSFVPGGNETSASASGVLYSKFDVHRLSRVVGTQRCQQMLASEQTVHMFVTGDQ